MTDFEPIFRDANARLSAEPRTAGKSVWSADAGDRQFEVLELAVTYAEDAGDEDAADLGRNAIVRDRVYAVDGKRVCWARSYLPAKLAEGTPIGGLNTGPGGVPARLAELGHELVSFSEDVEFVERENVTADERDRLGIDDMTAVVRIVRRGIDASGQVVKVSDMRLVAGAYRFRWAWTNR
ncbi:putative transcriptional regulator, GntR family [Catenulispora acidiphila DSM 44928]|uniref:Putative transcriptional regulator, GntR family n=1 Tax=Catenulispora acidiphila (strain DSM 44928 / JCM 14897 / NBRC 102108 / NRRL B-24433 / ID139908) TaxID=479433 RepID=C7Q2R3_CATAD|nr:UTRA domain-containing protein [Catenulispora acidiphila]ACU71805.1 putative transcriptional regulator, GntR family [Catenulispora acidiphila DSM 44928]